MMPGRPGSFAAYLEYTQRHQAAFASSRVEKPVNLLLLLSRQSEGAMSIGQLATASGLAAGAFYKELKASSEAGLLQVSGAPLEEIITITSKGRELGKLA